MNRALAVVVLFGTAACEEPPAQAGAGPPGEISMAELEGDLAIVREAKVYFNHQSVGFNLLEGVGRMRGAPRLQHLPSLPAAEEKIELAPGIVHTSLGANGDPLSKLRAFQDALGKMKEPPDVALTKLCFVDLNEKSDVDALFDAYSKTFDALATQYPNTRFVHVTVPLIIKKPRWKTMIKDVLGKGEDAYVNQQREALSDKLRKRYGDQLFDLAKVESTDRSGRQESFSHGGRQIPALLAEYSSDGAHLSPAGEDVVARAFIHALAQALRSKPAATP